MKRKNAKVGVEVIVKENADLQSVQILNTKLQGKTVYISEVYPDEWVLVCIGCDEWYLKLDMLKLANKGEKK